jgi:hypothetical protein
MDKNNKLLQRPIEKDTVILNESLVLFEDIPALMELWSWSGVTATSVIFLQEDFEGKSKDEIIEFVFKNIKSPIDPKATFKSAGDYIYINFNFRVPEYD